MKKISWGLIVPFGILYYFRDSIFAFLKRHNIILTENDIVNFGSTLVQTILLVVIIAIIAIIVIIFRIHKNDVKSIKNEKDSTPYKIKHKNEYTSLFD